MGGGKRPEMDGSVMDGNAPPDDETSKTPLPYIIYPIYYSLIAMCAVHLL